MNILSHGHPFWSSDNLLAHYAGEHDIRTLGKDAGAHFEYDPENENVGNALARVGKTFEPDLLVCWFPEEYPPPLDIEASPIRTAAVVGDWDIHYSEITVNRGRFDVTIVDLPGMTRFDAAYAPVHHAGPLYACAPRPPSKAHRDTDLFFAGTCNAARHRERNAALAGLWPLSAQHRVALGEGPTGDAYWSAMARARAVFNRSVRGELNMRFFESIVAGAVPLIESDNLEAHKYLVNDKAVCVYDCENPIDTIESLLGNAARCTEIVEQGQMLMQDEFSITRRFDELITCCLDAPGTGRPFTELSEADRHVHEILSCRAKRDERWQRREGAAISGAREAYADDPRVQSLAGNRALHHASAGHGATFDDALRHYEQALASVPGDGIFALNAATATIVAWAAGGSTDPSLINRAEGYLNIAANARHCLSDDVVFPDHWDSFWCTWQRQLAHGIADVSDVNAEAHHQLARIAIERGDVPGARDSISEAKRLAPTRSFADVSFMAAYTAQDWSTVSQLLLDDPGAFYTRDDVWSLAKQIADHTKDNRLAVICRQRSDSILWNS